MNTAFTRLLQINLPLIQAPMAGVSTPEMAAQVSNHGGLGSIAIGASTLEQAEQMIAKTRTLTSKPFNVNVFCHAPAQADPERQAAWMQHLAPYFTEFGIAPRTDLKEIYTSFLASPDMLTLLLDTRPAIVSFHFGLPPASTIDQLKAAGIRLIATATNLTEARAIEAAGLDAIVAQGFEAGGHRGIFDPEHDDAIGTFALIQILRAQTRLPIIASGGIMDGRGIAAALMLGASAAQLGTAYVPTTESIASAGYQALLLSPRAELTRITRAISGRDARGMVNRIISEVGQAAPAIVPDYPITYDAGKQLHAAALTQGSQEFGALWAGQAASLARAMDAAQLTQTLAAELKEALQSFSSRE